MFSMPTMPRPPLAYPGTPAATPHLRHLCLPAINAAIQEQTGQSHNVLLNPQPHEIEGLVQALGPGLSKIGITAQDCLDGLSKPLKKLRLTRPTVGDGEHSMYNSLVFERRPFGQKTDGMIMCVTTTKTMLNWVDRPAFWARAAGRRRPRAHACTRARRCESVAAACEKAI